MRILTIVICFIFLKLPAQNLTSGKIEYIVKTIDTTSLNLTKKDALEAQKYINDLSQGIKDKVIITEFNGAQSLSYEKKSMQLDSDKWAAFRSSLIGAKGNFYYNSSTKELLNQVENLGDKFIIIKKPSTLNWTFLNEEKQIGKYECYKAVKVDTSRSLNKNIIKKYIAWYSPELAIPFGPLEHAGLPGLILELNVLGGAVAFTLSAKEFSLNLNTEEQIKKPTKGRTVSENEYDSLIRIALTEILEKSKRN